MIWISLALLSALFLGFYDICKKHAVNDNAVIPVLTASVSCGALAMIPLLLGDLLMPELTQSLGIGLTALSPMEHLAVIGKAVIVCSSWICAYFGLKHLPISIAAPIRASSPIITIIAAVVFMSEMPSAIQWLGLVVAIGSYIGMSFIGRKEGIHFHRNHYIWLIILGTIIGAASALYDKYLLQQVQIPPLTLQVWFAIYCLPFMLTVLMLTWWPKRKKLTLFTWRWTIAATGLLLAISDITYFYALHHEDAYISLISAIRRSSVIVAVAMGGALFKDQSKRLKLLALSGILTGIIIIIFGN